MTLLTLLGKQTTTYCIVCWPEEENELSVLSANKIISPSQEGLAPDTFCKVKGFESHLCKIVAVGSESEIKKKIAELDDETEKPPPKKKLCVEKTSKGRAQRSGKENKTPSRQKRKEGKKGKIILVAAEQSTYTAVQSNNSQPTLILQNVTNTSSTQPVNLLGSPPTATPPTVSATVNQSPKQLTDYSSTAVNRSPSQEAPLISQPQPTLPYKPDDLYSWSSLSEEATSIYENVGDVCKVSKF